MRNILSEATTLRDVREGLLAEAQWYQDALDSWDEGAPQRVELKGVLRGIDAAIAVVDMRLRAVNSGEDR